MYNKNKKLYNLILIVCQGIVKETSQIFEVNSLKHEKSFTRKIVKDLLSLIHQGFLVPRFFPRQPLLHLTDNVDGWHHGFHS